MVATQGGLGPCIGKGAKSAKMAALLAVSLFGAQQAAAQTCQPDKLYDIIVGNFHESVAQRTDGSWAGWGQKMRPANTPELSPTDLASYLTGLDAGTILLSSVASCRIPDDCIDPKRYPLFMARAVLQELIESLQSTQEVKPC